MGSRPDHSEMVGRLLLGSSRGYPELALCAQAILVFTLPLLSQGQDCSMFKKEYCNLQLDKIMMLDTNMKDAQECQTACFERGDCKEFTFFSGTNSRCVLFSQCSNPVSSCKSCLSGPPYPRVLKCDSGRSKGASSQRQNTTNERRSPRPRSFQTRPSKKSNGPTRPVRPSPQAFEGSFRSAAQNELPENDPETKNVKKTTEPKNKPKVDDGLLDDDDDEDEENVDIDNDLLDEVFQDLPGTRNARPPQPQPKRRFPQRGQNRTNCPSCPGGGGFYYCLMGGRNQNGPISTVSVMNVGSYALPRRPPIAAFPPEMTRGSGRTFSVYSGQSLHTCTPGYPITTITPASTFHNGFGPSFLSGQSFVPGTCNGYDFRSRLWSPTGGKMTTVRQGGSTLNVGSYIMSLGGYNPFGQPLTSVDIFDPRRPQTGWHTVPQWNFPRATKDMCTVVTKDPKLGSQVMVMGGLGEEHSVMRLVLGTNNWFSVPPMNFPRTQHACSSVTLNGRPGVVVSGGVDGNRFNTSTVEFFDMNTHRWVNLPSLSRGRRGHTMTTVEGQLSVAGGTALKHEGDIEYLDDVEIFDGRRWKRANYRMSEPREGANLIKIPIRSFG